MVLQDSPPRMPAHRSSADAHAHASSSSHNFASADASLAPSAAGDASETSRPIQLRRWLCKLAGWLVSAEERVVLSRAWQGVPQSGWRLRNILGALRLQRRLRQLAGRVECRQEGLVLLEQRQGLPSRSRRVCLDPGRKISTADGAGPVGHLPALRADVSGPSVFA